MSNEMMALTSFTYESSGVRVLGTKLEPWFVAVDVLRVLGIHTKNISRILDGLDEDEKGVVNLTTEADSSVVNLTTEGEIVQGSHNTVWIVSEPGLYKIMLRSRTPKAEAFTRFVTHEVLPSIRKRGYYKAPKPVKQKRLTRGRPPLSLEESVARKCKYELANGEKCCYDSLVFYANMLNATQDYLGKNRAEQLIAYINDEMRRRGLEATADIHPPYNAAFFDDVEDETYTLVIDGVKMEFVK